MTATIEIRRLAETDVPDATRLSTQAGWNQTGEDWRRLLALAPEGCFGGWIGGELVATGTVVTYGGAVSWIGMILVAKRHRRNGYGSEMFEHVRGLAERRGTAVGLDATDAGREVYRREGFVDVTPIERWSGRLGAPGNTPLEDATACSVDMTTARADEIDAICSLDRRACGVDRGDLLGHLLGTEGVTGFVARDEGEERSEIRGYALVRPGREHRHVGPVVASSRAATAAMLTAIAETVGSVDGAELDVLIDLLRTERDGDLLERAGLVRQRRLTRMASREPTPLLVGDDVVAGAGFELG
ncbi:GNAT family N-acetyltransferase [Natronoglomus mannanivorans]|uniref:GNAT family N-acetyltransferase n=1 Tax=Natronoglomus mannanivorans TaxID=2979990 RepID=A0AAP2Z2N7_9EURY|nr:GNAT family N-acetyltransferase [Halobacteria archaeon AArc-xg1-1]